MTTALKTMTLLAPDKESQSAFAVLPKSRDFKLILQVDSRNLKRINNLFIAVSATALPEVADIVKQANETKLLRVLFIRENIPAEWLPQMLGRAELRMVRNILVHSGEDWETPLRIVRAWRFGSQRDLIARASVCGESLLVMNCALESFEIACDDLTPLKKIPKAKRSEFRISDSGSYIYWESGDVHLDIDAIRYATDENWRKKLDLERLTHNKNFGRAIASIRKQYDLDKTDIPGVSDRQLRRIENEGARPSIHTLTALAKAHNKDTNAYLGELANCLSKVKINPARL